MDRVYGKVVVVVVTLFSNIIDRTKINQIQTWLIKHTQDIVNMYYAEGHQKKP